MLRTRSAGHRATNIGAIAITTVLVGCSGDPMPTAPKGLPRLSTQFAIAAADSQSRTGREPEAVPTRLALAIPGFGGVAYDTANGDLLIWLKDTTRAGIARAAVAQYQATMSRGRGGRAGRNPPVRIRQADFDFLELGSLRDRTNAALGNEPDVHFVQISPFTNRVEVGVAAAAIDRLAAALARAGVPREAVLFVASPSFDESSDPNDPLSIPPQVDSMAVDSAQGFGAPNYLNFRQQLVGGGVKITFLRPVTQGGVTFEQQFACSVGAIVKDASGQQKMLTAGHCSNQLGANDGRQYWQPHINKYDKTKPVSELPFAGESLDPGWKSALPSYIAYKWADALLANVPLNAQTPDFGHIHRPASSRTDWFAPPSEPSYQIDAVKPRFTITGPGSLNDVGELLDKVGYRTGWTRGPTTNNCADLSYGSGALRHVYRCQVQTNIPAWFGDSGCSVFRVLAGGDGTQVEFMGSQEGVSTASHLMYFAPWAKIQQELGSLTVAP